MVFMFRLRSGQRWSLGAPWGQGNTSAVGREPRNMKGEWGPRTRFSRGPRTRFSRGPRNQVLQGPLGTRFSRGPPSSNQSDVCPRPKVTF